MLPRPNHLRRPPTMPVCSFRPPSPSTWACPNWQCLDLGRAPGRANAGDKMMTLIVSALAGGDCIDDADALRTGGTASPWAPRSRRHPPWAPFCAASGGATSVNSTG